jgi:hypothetical protein
MESNGTMVYSTEQTPKRAAPIRRTIDYGTKVILLVVGVGLFRTEILRIASLPWELDNVLYLVLLGAVALLTVGWIFVSNKELDIMCDFLAPLEYRIPDENFIGIAIAIALTILLYTSRNPLWFGISYSIYMLLSVSFWKRGITDVDKAIKGSRKLLQRESKQKREIYEGALDVIEAYYVRQRNMPRVWASLFLGLVGLILAILAVTLDRKLLNTIAYNVYIISIVGLEGVLRSIGDLSCIRE